METNLFWECICQKPIVYSLTYFLSLEDIILLIGTCKKLRLLWHIDLVCEKKKNRTGNNFGNRVAEILVAREWRSALRWTEKFREFNITYDMNTKNPLDVIWSMKERRAFYKKKNTGKTKEFDSLVLGWRIRVIKKMKTK